MKGEKYALNFGDCSPLAGRCGAREYRFGQAVGSDALQALAAADFRADADPDHLQNPDGSTHINLWYRLTTAFAEQELMECAALSFAPENAAPAIREIAGKRPRHFVLRDSSMASDSVATNFDQIFETYSSSTVRRVL